MQLISRFFTAYSQVISSFYYIAILLIVYIQINKNAQLAENWLGIMKNSLMTQLYYVTLYGLLGGIVISFLLMVFKINIEYEAFLMLWPMSIALSISDQHYMCPSYSVGILSLISLIFGKPDINVPSLIILVGILHVLESLLIFIDGNRDSIALYIEHERLVPAGAFINEKLWPIPFSAILAQGQFFFPSVVVLAYHDFIKTKLPKKRIIEYALWTLGYASIIILLGLLSRNIKAFAYISSIVMIVFHEGIYRLLRYWEMKGEPYFIAPWIGLMVLEVSPYSVGEEMGIKSGDIILSLNGQQVNSESKLKEMLDDYPRSLYLEVKREGDLIENLSYENYKLGVGNLGLIIIPRTSSKFYRFKRTGGLFSRINKNKIDEGE